MMALNNHDQAKIREYLLGKLNELEQERIEERLMVEDELFDELEASKDDLIDQYRAGELEQAERRWFEEHFLASKEARERHAFVVAMDCLQQSQPLTVTEKKPIPEPHLDPPPTFFERITGFMKARPWAVATATAVVLVVAVAIALRSRPGGEGPTFNATLASYGQTRGDEGVLPTKIKLPPNTANLKLRLQLSRSAEPGTTYKAELDNRVNRQSVPVVASDSESATVLIPTSQVPRGEYLVKLNIIRPDGTEQERSYRFNVE